MGALTGTKSLTCGSVETLPVANNTVYLVYLAVLCADQEEIINLLVEVERCSAGCGNDETRAYTVQNIFLILLQCRNKQQYIACTCRENISIQAKTIYSVICNMVERRLILGSSPSSGESDKVPFSFIRSRSVNTSSFCKQREVMSSIYLYICQSIYLSDRKVLEFVESTATL